MQNTPLSAPPGATRHELTYEDILFLEKLPTDLPTEPAKGFLAELVPAYLELCSRYNCKDSKILYIIWALILHIHNLESAYEISESARKQFEFMGLLQRCGLAHLTPAEPASAVRELEQRLTELSMEKRELEQRLSELSMEKRELERRANDAELLMSHLRKRVAQVEKESDTRALETTRRCVNSLLNLKSKQKIELDSYKLQIITLKTEIDDQKMQLSIMSDQYLHDKISLTDAKNRAEQEAERAHAKAERAHAKAERANAKAKRATKRAQVKAVRYMVETRQWAVKHRQNEIKKRNLWFQVRRLKQRTVTVAALKTDAHALEVAAHALEVAALKTELADIARANSVLDDRHGQALKQVKTALQCNSQLIAGSAELNSQLEKALLQITSLRADLNHERTVDVRFAALDEDRRAHILKMRAHALTVDNECVRLSKELSRLEGLRTELTAEVAVLNATVAEATRVLNQLEDRAGMSLLKNPSAARSALEAVVAGAASSECNRCRKPATMKCSKCKCIYYCGQECQRMDWLTHKPTCAAAQ